MLDDRGVRLDDDGVPCDSPQFTDAFRMCGIINDDPAIRKPQARIPPEDYACPAAPRKTTLDHQREIREDGRLQCATDGSGIHPREERLRKCAHAIYFGKDHSWNVPKPLLGPQQTTPISELRAILDLTPRVQEPTTVHVDCKFVVDALHHLIRTRDPPLGAHKDPWQRIATAYHQIQDPSWLEVEWIPSHLSKELAEEERWPLVAHDLNDKVDALAKKGRRSTSCSPPDPPNNYTSA